MDKEKVEFLLQILSGVFWTVTYIDCIRVGIKHKLCAMPTFALMLNLGWEGVQTIGEFAYHAHGEDSLQGYADLCWLFFDVGILITFFLYGRKEFSFFDNRKMFYWWFLLCFLCSTSVQICVVLQYGFVDGAVLTAFPQNLLMSVQFVDLIMKRQCKKGSSYIIAFCKWLGTLFPTIVFGIMRENWMCLATGGFAGVFDIIYLIMFFKFPIEIENMDNNLIPDDET